MTAASEQTLERTAPPITPAPAPARRKRRWFLPAYTAVIIGYLFLPVLVMITFGFNDHQGRFNLTWEGFTLRWYRELFTIPELTLALKNSLIIAAVSTVIATAFGSLLALALTRYRLVGRSMMNLFVFVPMSTPEVVMGASLLSMFVTIGLGRGFLTIIIAHILFSISYVVVTVKARTSGFDRHLEDAAQDLGADGWTTFWTVTFPLIFPGILAAGMLAFVLSIDDYVITSFNAGSVITLPLWIYGATRIGVPAQVNVIGTGIFCLGLLYVLVAIWRGRREGEVPPPVVQRG